MGWGFEGDWRVVGIQRRWMGAGVDEGDGRIDVRIEGGCDESGEESRKEQMNPKKPHIQATPKEAGNCLDAYLPYLPLRSRGNTLYS